jgi:hypothetical protein
VFCHEDNITRSDHKFFPPTGMASFWNSVTGAVELTGDLAEVTEDKTNVTTKLYDSEHKKQRCMCAKVSHFFPNNNF